MCEYHMTVTQFVTIAVMIMMMVSKMGEFQHSTSGWVYQSKFE